MEVCLAIKEFFYNSKLLGEVNSTLIALIPKVSTPNKVSEFRPISCCNVIYKCISKILTNRIKGGLNKELLRGYNRKNGPKRCAMQIDIQKAYDTVSWNFLEDILGKFGFHKKMVTWIMTCVRSTSFSICLNGETHGYFKGGRGLRQGDLMSPYLFTLVMEVFSLIMEKNIEESNGFGYHFGCKELKLSHMCFADDLLVLCKGNKDSIEVIKKSLEEFSKASGLVPNLEAKLESLGKWFVGQRIKVVRVSNLLKNGMRSICDVNMDKSDSWGWKSMLKIRDDIKNHVWYDIGDGRSISMWYDRWCMDGPLCSLISRRDIYDARLDDNAKVSDMISNNQWNWPNGWKEKYALLNNLDGVVRLSNKDDKVLWVTNVGDKVRFTTKQAWEDLKDNWPLVNWRHVVWFNQIIPRQAFIMWMVVQDKLLTQDKIERWKQSDDLKCRLCKQCGDSMHHLFFQCEIPRNIWTKLMKLSFKMDLLVKLQDVVDSMVRRCGKNNIGNVVDKLILVASVYFIWQEKNFRLFKNESRSEDVLTNLIYDSVRSKLMTMRVKKTSRTDVIAKK
ncbi:RNA-directed DNA polymerase, eukaryota, reverse transcriptase zinc-binding domain protein [Tanacetum coccineum]